MTTDRNAIVLLSGGLDSTTVLAIASQQGYRCHALSFDYGQRHRTELAAARRVAEQYSVTEHIVATIDLRLFGGSALTADIEVPKHAANQTAPEAIPITYVPARNTVFLSFALAWAEVVSASDIFIGVNAMDYSGYPDCRPEYIDAFEKMANLATVAGVSGKQQTQIHAPLMQLTKADIIKRGIELGVDFALTTSCYDPNDEGLSCGLCDSCVLRRNGFAEAGLQDLIGYAKKG